jgi:hypothetical protein
MNLRRYELRLFHYSRRLLKNEKTIVSLDLVTGPGIQHAHFYMDQMLTRLALAAGVRTGDIVNCRVEAIDEETGQSVYFYPAPQ